MTSSTKYSGMRVNVIESNSHPLKFRCSGTDPTYVFENTITESAKLQIKNKHSKTITIKPNDDMEDDFTLILPPGPGEEGNPLLSKGNGVTQWGKLAIGNTGMDIPEVFSIGLEGNDTCLVLGNPKEDANAWKLLAGEKFTVFKYENDNWVKKIHVQP